MSCEVKYQAFQANLSGILMSLCLKLLQEIKKSQEYQYFYIREMKVVYHMANLFFLVLKLKPCPHTPPLPTGTRKLFITLILIM